MTVSVQPSFFGRLLGVAKRANQDSVNGPNRSPREIPAGDLGKKLRNSFRSFLESRIRKPWAASKVAFTYIDMVHNTYVRTEERVAGKSSGWYVQLNFSGCSGMAEVSAELAAHWASIWFGEHRDEIGRNFLAPFGFEANFEKDSWLEALRFFPVGELGYAKFFQSAEVGASSNHTHRFEIDCAMSETFSETELDEFLGELDSKFAGLFLDVKCCCQLCSPQLDAERIASSLARFIR